MLTKKPDPIYCAVCGGELIVFDEDSGTMPHGPDTTPEDRAHTPEIAS